MNVSVAPQSQQPANQAGGIFVIFMFFLIFAVLIGIGIWTQLPYWRCMSKMNDTGEVDANCEKIIKLHQRQEALDLEARERARGREHGSVTINL